MDDSSIKTYSITVPITKSALTLSIRGDFHYGIRDVDAEEGAKTFEREQDQHRDNQFILYTGDLVENNLTGSVGHGYDIEIRDPATQVKDIAAMLTRVQKHLYGSTAFNKLSLNSNTTLAAGVIGNHEYRSRNTAGVWLQEALYGPGKILDLKMNGLLSLKIVNKKLKMEKTYKIFVSHRPNNSNATSIETILRAAKRKKGDIPADIYVFGHYHRRVIHGDGTYDSNGQFKKVLYVVNPSPISYVEYADWAGFSPLSSSWYCNIFLPLQGNAWGKV